MRTSFACLVVTETVVANLQLYKVLYVYFITILPENLSKHGQLVDSVSDVVCQSGQACSCDLLRVEFYYLGAFILEHKKTSPGLYWDIIMTLLPYL